MTNEDIKRMVAASDAGDAAARALKIGDTFLGAGPAADAAGITPTFGPAWRMFVHAYLHALPAGIWTDRENRITRIGQPKRRAAA